MSLGSSACMGHHVTQVWALTMTFPRGQDSQHLPKELWQDESAALQTASAFLEAVPTKKQGSQDTLRGHLEQPLPTSLQLTYKYGPSKAGQNDPHHSVCGMCSLGEGGDSVVPESSP